MSSLLDELVDTVRRPAEWHLPAATHRHAALLVADTLGVMLAGGRYPEAVRLVEGDELTGSWRSGTAGTGARFLTAGHGWGEPDRAAYVNATACCALELDEGIRPTGHPAAHVLPAALAAAEVVDARWQDLLTAFIAGYEVTAGLFAGLRLRPPAHPHGHLGGAGAAVAVALLTGHDPLPPARVAATIPLLTTWAPCLEGASARNTWAGHAAAASLLAQRLVRAGYRGSDTALESTFDGLLGDRVDAGTAALGSRTTAGYVKLYSACALTHSAIEAALSLGPLSRESVASVRVEVNANSMRTACQPADNALSRRFSLPYAVAVALLHADAGPARFDVPDSAALHLARIVTVNESPDMTAMWPRLAPAAVTVTPQRGQPHTAEVHDARGHPGNPAGTDALRDKFRTLTALPDAVWDLLVDQRQNRPVRAVLDILTRRDRTAK